MYIRSFSFYLGTRILLVYAITAYWLMYNTNGGSTSVNNLILSPGGTFVWRQQPFGTRPASFGAHAGSSGNSASLYATLGISVSPTPVPISTPTVTPSPVPYTTPPGIPGNVRVL